MDRRLEETSLKEQEDWVRKNHWHLAEIIELAINGSFTNWACDFCYTNGKAIKPDYSKQNFGMGGPIIAYIDKHFNCQKCHIDFTFNAAEQKFWYEDLQFTVDAKPNYCVDCRKTIRQVKNAHAQLAIELKNLNKKDADQLKRIADLYLAVKSINKSEEFNNRAKNILKVKKNDDA
jgi:hypothetical protein